MNVIDDEGIKALINVFPSLKVISTLFVKEESSYETEMDFGLLEGTNILKLPRSTSGYFFNDEFFFDFNNGLWSYGAWTHFIHLDDSYDNNRNKGIPWQNLIKEFQFQIDYIKKNYPFLRFYTARDAYYILLDYEMSDYKFFHDKNKKEIDIKISSIGSKNEKYILIRLPENSILKKIENGKLVYIFPEKDFIIIKTIDYITRIIYD